MSYSFFEISPTFNKIVLFHGMTIENCARTLIWESSLIQDKYIKKKPLSPEILHVNAIFETCEKSHSLTCSGYLPT